MSISQLSLSRNGTSGTNSSGADSLDEFREVPKGLRDGFCIGSTFKVASFHIPPNHKSTLDNPETVNKYIAKEMATGHYLKPYNPTVLGNNIGYFHTSHIGVVNKDGKTAL